MSRADLSKLKILVVGSSSCSEASWSNSEDINGFLGIWSRRYPTFDLGNSLRNLIFNENVFKRVLTLFIFDIAIKKWQKFVHIHKNYSPKGSIDDFSRPDEPWKAGGLQSDDKGQFTMGFYQNFDTNFLGACPAPNFGRERSVKNASKIIELNEIYLRPDKPLKVDGLQFHKIERFEGCFPHISVHKLIEARPASLYGRERSAKDNSEFSLFYGPASVRPRLERGRGLSFNFHNIIHVEISIVNLTLEFKMPGEFDRKTDSKNTEDVNNDTSDGEITFKETPNESLATNQVDAANLEDSLASYAGDSSNTCSGNEDNNYMPDLVENSCKMIMSFKDMASKHHQKILTDEEKTKWQFNTAKVQALKAIKKIKMLKVKLRNVGVDPGEVALRPMKDTIYELITDPEHLALPPEIIINHDLINDDKNPRIVGGITFENGLNHFFTLKIFTTVYIDVEVLYGEKKSWIVGEGKNTWEIGLPGYKKETQLYARAYVKDFNISNLDILKALKNTGYYVVGDAVNYETTNFKNMPGFAKSNSVKNFRFFYPALYNKNQDGSYDDIVIQVWSKYFKQYLTITFNVYDRSNPLPQKCIACNQESNICKAKMDTDICIYRGISIKRFKEKILKLKESTEFVLPVLRQEIITEQTTEKEQEYFKFYFSSIKNNESSSDKQTRISAILAFEGEKTIREEEDRIRAIEEKKNEFQVVKKQNSQKAPGPESGAIPKKNIQFVQTVSFHALKSRQSLIGLTKDNVIQGLIKAPIDRFEDSYARCFASEFDIPKMTMILKKLEAWSEALKLLDKASASRQTSAYASAIETSVKNVLYVKSNTTN